MYLLAWKMSPSTFTLKVLMNLFNEPVQRLKSASILCRPDTPRQPVVVLVGGPTAQRGAFMRRFSQYLLREQAPGVSFVVFHDASIMNHKDLLRRCFEGLIDEAGYLGRMAFLYPESTLIQLTGWMGSGSKLEQAIRRRMALWKKIESEPPRILNATRVNALGRSQQCGLCIMNRLDYVPAGFDN